LVALLSFAGFAFFGKQGVHDISPDMIATKLSSLSQSFIATYPSGLVIDIASTGVTTNAT
jgi:hypothetical protein